MKEQPRSLESPILSKFMVSRLITVASAMAIVAIGCYLFFASMFDHAYGRTIAFNALVVMQWASAFAARSDYRPSLANLKVLNIPFYVGLFIAITLQLLALFGPLGTLLHVTPVAMEHLVITSIIAFGGLFLVAETHKFIGRHFFNKGNHRLVANNGLDMIQ